MDATPFIFRSGHVPLSYLYDASVGYYPAFPSVPTPEDLFSNYAIFKEIDGDKGLRNATHFFWNLKKLSVTFSSTLTYATSDPTNPSVTVSLERSHVAYGPIGSFFIVSPQPTAESDIPQPARNVVSISNGSVGFWHLDPILPAEILFKYDKRMIVSIQMGGVWFIESLQRWVATISINVEFSAATWDASREERKGFGDVDLFSISPGEVPSGGYSVVGATFPDIFEENNRIQYLAGYGDSATVDLTISAEYWTYTT